jgi:hypothetical protein
MAAVSCVLEANVLVVCLSRRNAITKHIWKADASQAHMHSNTIFGKQRQFLPGVLAFK